MLQKYDRVTTVGYVNLKPTDGEPVEPFPWWLPQGIHNISEVRETMAGVLVKTDRIREWTHSDWFEKI